MSRSLIAGAILGASSLVFAAPQTDNDALAARGEYVARLADCVACHTAPGGPPMAGGLAMKTPVGTLYSSNITPDEATGIAAYTFEQFDRALRRGVAADGRNLYSAMPYPAYTKISAEDMRALYAYVRSLPPVRQANREADMQWPFSMRWGLRLWNVAFHEDMTFRPDPSRDAEWNRGAYLVQSLGHCGACHTPRGIAFQEKGTTHASADYLAGETIEAWRAPSLRGGWPIEDTVQLLKTGQSPIGAVSGSMVQVVMHSMQYASDGDLRAIAIYLQSLPPAGDVVSPPAPQRGTIPAGLYDTRGGLGYVQFCAECHRADGSGVAGVFPPLAGNPTVASRDPSTLIHITLTGWNTASTAAHPRTSTMAAFNTLYAPEIAEILTFVRATWGAAPPVTAPEVRRMRESLGVTRTAAEFRTPRFAHMLVESNAEQLVRGMRLHNETAALLPANVGNRLTCSFCHLNAGTVADGSPFVGVAASFPGYAPRAGRIISLEDRINGCFLRSMNGKALPVDSADMRAMVAYFAWMKGAFGPEDKIPGRGVGKIDASIKPDAARGAKVYEAQCEACHGRDGEGLRDASGRVVYPALWGDESFNIGAGMARTYTAAAFVKRNMPVGFQRKFPLGQGGLSDQDAVDVAEYFSHQLRPDFAAKVKDWPKDPKPADSRY